ncbi:MAG: hypothetical protein LKJ75_01210 [Clostridia bacterium]|jgi:hypothetical protein|nr:hypothetical protein [Clostridia bacterium]MCI2013806.1 hypothetical protein [Clostridia bacterium]
MNFAYINFEKGNTKKGHTPDFIRRLYIEKLKREKIKKINMLGAKGDIITLPFKKDEPDFELISKYIEEMFVRNSLYNIRGLSVQDGLKCFVKNACSGELFSAFFAEDIMKKMCKDINEDSELKVTVSDGGDTKTKVVLECLSRLPVRVGLLTDNRNEAEKTLEEIYSRTGLCVSTYASEKNRNVQSSDVFIKCRSFEKNNFFMKKNSIFIDFTDNFGYILSLARKRKDLKIFSARNFKKGDRLYSAAFCEALCEAACDEFFKISRYGFDTQRFNESYRFLHKYFSANDCEKLTMRER